MPIPTLPGGPVLRKMPLSAEQKRAKKQTSKDGRWSTMRGRSPPVLPVAGGGSSKDETSTESAVPSFV